MMILEMISSLFQMGSGTQKIEFDALRSRRPYEIEILLDDFNLSPVFSGLHDSPHQFMVIA